MPRPSVPIDPNAPEKPRRNFAAEREKRARQEFLDRPHPLARMYRGFHYHVLAMSGGYWSNAALQIDFFVRGLANLDEETRALFEECLPKRPDFHWTPGNDAEWLVYLTRLLTSKSARERLGERLREVIVEKFGEEFLPTIWETCASVCIEEPPF